MRGLTSKRIVHLEPNQITAVAASNRRFKRQPPAQLCEELRAQPRFANDKCACGAHVHGIVAAQFSGKQTGTKSPPSSNVDTPNEDDQCHAVHCCSTEGRRRSGSARDGRSGVASSLLDRNGSRKILLQSPPLTFAMRLHLHAADPHFARTFQRRQLDLRSHPRQQRE